MVSIFMKCIIQIKWEMYIMEFFFFHSNKKLWIIVNGTNEKCKFINCIVSEMKVSHFSDFWTNYIIIVIGIIEERIKHMRIKILLTIGMSNSYMLILSDEVGLSYG
jgi:uncharacterized protein YbgA (DUF1722 family)